MRKNWARKISIRKKRYGSIIDSLINPRLLSDKINVGYPFHMNCAPNVVAAIYISLSHKDKISSNYCFI